jgi:hypothetical protein
MEMKRGWVWALVGVNLVAIIALVFAFPHLMISPGSLIPAHATLAENCSSCHAPFRGAPPEKCVSCHAVADIGIRATTGALIAGQGMRPAFHQALVTQACLSCHVEHPGANPAAREPTFSHALLNGKMRSQCSSCHVPPADALHADKSANCATCHSQNGWKPATFDHDRFFPLIGPHKATCATCHTKNDFSTYTCFSCHEHEPGRVRVQHLEEGIRNIDNCVSCHRKGEAEKEGEQGSDD